MSDGAALAAVATPRMRLQEVLAYCFLLKWLVLTAIFGMAHFILCQYGGFHPKKGGVLNVSLFQRPLKLLYDSEAALAFTATVYGLALKGVDGSRMLTTASWQEILDNFYPDQTSTWEIPAEDLSLRLASKRLRHPAGSFSREREPRQCHAPCGARSGAKLGCNDAGR